MRVRRLIRYWVAWVAVAAAIVGGLGFAALRLSLPGEGQASVYGLSAPVSVAMDRFGVPLISAGSRLDAFRALGYVSARDRLFQMDVLRRKSAGRLAEIFGEAAVGTDREQRVFGFEGVTREVARRIPTDQREALAAYADGVNGAIERMTVLPFEFLLLGHRPERWRIEDSLLVVLGMFDTLSKSEWEERMLSVMERALPSEVYRFLTPETDHYTRSVLGEGEFERRAERVPVEVLRSLLGSDGQGQKQADLVRTSLVQPGSNAWAVAGVKTQDGRAILANDMHLAISVPSVWYRCQLRFEGVDIDGVNLPGTPLIIAGATRRLAWGMTTLIADVLDLVKIEVNPEDPEEYRTPEGWRRFEKRHESIGVKGASARGIDIKTTIWGPVAMKPLLGQPVAIHWTALDPEAVNIGLLDIDQAETLEQGLTVMNKTGGPPLNVILADNSGRVAWTTMGRLPLRRGFDGAVSRSWTDGSVGWTGYIPPAELPRGVDPPQGFVVSANNRAVGKDYPYPIGHGFASGYRAYRIAERLRAMDRIEEEDMLRLQLDTTAGAYGFYRDIALGALTPKALKDKPGRRELRDHLEAWDGRAEVGSLGLGVLIRFREALAKAVFEPLLRSCRALDEAFQYHWVHLDLPLQAVLTAKDPRLVPERESHSDWDAFLLAKLEESAQALMQQHSVESLRDLTWGRINVAEYAHPLSGGLPGLGIFLDLPRDPLPGCGFCVRVDSARGGASERLVVSPAHPEDGILKIPGGQSGHPLSPHYRDQHPYWVNGLPIPFRSGETTHSLQLVPAEPAGAN
ncbi:MAG: penicillin acylase family protein [Gammaproteobacteria bacterium]